VRRASKVTTTQEEFKARDEENARAILVACEALGLKAGEAQEFADRTIVNSQRSRRPCRS